MTVKHSMPLLFSIDLEEFYPADLGADVRATSLEKLADVYLRLLAARKTKGTFFVVGDAARRFPGVLRAIISEGHEIGCHGNRHITLDSFTPESFAFDLRANRDAIQSAVDTQIFGFRAPLLSITRQTSWAYDVLRQEGFTYSSSVLPARNPLFGWPDFGTQPTRIEGVWEIPVTLLRFPLIGHVPGLSGTYFRVLPWWFIRRKVARLPEGIPCVSYFHPYDVDHLQPWILHAGVRRSRVLNSLLFLRRASLAKRLDLLLGAFRETMTHEEFARQLSIDPCSPASSH